MRPLRNQCLLPVILLAAGISVQAQQSPTPTPEPAATPSATPEARPAAPASPAPTQFAPPAYDEIVVTAVGDVMLGTTFPDDSGGDLPPNDGTGLLDEVAPILKYGDVVFGNLEGPLVDGGDSAKCHGKRVGTCFAFRVPTRY